MCSNHRSFAALAALTAAIVAGCAETPTDLADAPAPAFAAMAATQTQFEGVLHGCDGTPPQELFVTAGGTLHITGAGNTNLWVSDNPLVSGIEENVVDVNVNLNQDVVRAHATATITPEGIDGAWDVRFTVKVGGRFAGEAYGVGQGTGALEGMTIRFLVTPVEGVANVCNADFPFVAVFSGTITASARP